MDLLAAVVALLAVFALLWAAMSLALPRGYRRLRRLTAHWVDPLVTRFSVPLGGAKPYLPLFLVFAAGTILIFWASDAFFDLVEGLQKNSPALQQVDQNVYGFLFARRSNGLTDFFNFFSVLGTPVALGIITTVVAIALIATGRYRWAAYLVLTVLIGGYLNVALKHYFVRPRPDLAEALRGARGTAFPSGHAMGSIIVFGALSYLALRSVKRWRTASAILAAAVTIVLAIALSRIYLGVHWISDIAAGLTVGAVWVLATTTTYEAVRRVRILRARSEERRARSAAKA